MTKMRLIMIIILLIAFSTLLVACGREITTFDECVEAGNPAMESYPRQCRSEDKVFIEEVAVRGVMEIAQASECVEKGDLTEEYTYNGETDTWWVNLDVKREFEKEDCDPVCIVDIEAGTAKINWGCKVI